MKKIELLLDRKFKSEKYVIGKLYIDGIYFCDTIEDTDRGLSDSMTIEEIKKIKKATITAIPTGTYKVAMNIVSPKYYGREPYKTLCGGRLPRLLNVKGYDGILIHIGNKPEDTDGCILVGENKVKGQVINSTSTFIKLYNIIKEADQITITIK